MLGNLIPFFFSGNSLQEYIAYYNRVLGDGGTLVDPVGTQSILKMLKDNARLDNVKLLWYGGAGVKKVISGINTNVSKAYSIQLPSNDLTQTTAPSQPWQSGNIAPNEKPCLLNPQSGVRTIEHPAINFANNVAWSVTTMVNWNGTNEPYAFYVGTKLNYGLLLRLFTNVVAIREYTSGAYKSGTKSTSSLIGKNSVISFTCDNAGNLSYYFNGIFQETLSGIDTQAAFFGIMKYGSSFNYHGKYYYHLIQSGALSASQVAAEYNTLRALIPERESVTIGSQAWTTSNLDIVCDAQGVVIPEVTDNAAWAALTTPAWCHYNNDPANGAIYGKLYNWYAVKQIDDALAATGSEWRVPTQAQFNTLATTLGGASVAGGKMKVAGTTYFASPNTGATNESGFTALGGGYRRFDTGAFTQLTGACVIPSITTDGTFCSLLSVDNSSAASVISAFGRLKQGSSIRLVKNL